MLLLRWTLGISSALACVTWIVLAVLGARFRRGWGATPAARWLAVGPPIVFALVAASVLRPDSTTLMHATTVAISLIAIASVRVSRESPGIGITGLSYCSFWCVYYLGLL